MTIAFLIPLLLITFAFWPDNKEVKPTFVKISENSSVTRVNNFFKKNTTTEVVSNQIIWSLYKTELTQETVYAAANAKTENEKRNFKDNFRKQGGKIYRQVCYNLHAFDESWSLGYCVHKNL